MTNPATDFFINAWHNERRQRYHVGGGNLERCIISIGLFETILNESKMPLGIQFINYDGGIITPLPNSSAEWRVYEWHWREPYAEDVQDVSFD